jgi:orotidine-5'-phosphate decarboxylase
MIQPKLGVSLSQARMTTFSERLTVAVRRRQTPVLVGLDPRWESLPKAMRGPSAPADPVAKSAAYVKFCAGIIDVVAPLVPAVKPQVAFFEELGPSGMAALAEVITYARKQNLLVIVDAKRNDIGSTAAAYTSAYFGPDAAWPADALTVSPYLGDDSLTPFIEAARKQAGGVFVLVKTSNPGGGQFQDLPCNGRPLYRHVAQYVEQAANSDVGPSGYGSVGAVVGATYPEQLAELRAAMPHAWFLIPGYGSQGGTAKDVAAGFDNHGLGSIVNNSRGIIFAHERREYQQFGEARWQEAVEASARDMIAALKADTPAGKLAR